jgi:cob(I)alamin adenosyltransferase
MPRLSKIYTRSGDQGETSLAGGQRVSKDDPLVCAYGSVDELNAVIGLARSLWRADVSDDARRLDEILAGIQNQLFNLGAQLSTPKDDFREGMPCVSCDQIAALEALMDEMNAVLGPLREFILPGGAPAAAALHQARTVCRRVERSCIGLLREGRIHDDVIPYLNRLGDALFVLARWANKVAGVADVCWRR